MLQKNSPADASTGVIFISPARVILISPKGVSPACPKGPITRAFSNLKGSTVADLAVPYLTLTAIAAALSLLAALTYKKQA